MKRELLEWLNCSDCGAAELTLAVAEEVDGEVKAGRLACRCGRSAPIKNYIPRFVRDDGYVGNFSFEWDVHRRTQLDSANGTRESELRFAAAMDFPLTDLKGKVVLDVGCGAGRFAEIALKYGGTVVGVDLSYAVDAAFANMRRHPRMHIAQADVFELPFKGGSFDLIYSLGVLHHTPDPRKALVRLVPLLKPGGRIAVQLYPAYNRAYVLATEFWRKLTTRLPIRALYALSHLAVPLYFVYRIPGLYHIGCATLPICMHPCWRWRVLDTFDLYSPKFQSHHTHYEVFNWFEEAGLEQIKVREAGITLIARRPYETEKDGMSTLSSVSSRVPRVHRAGISESASE